MKRSGKIVFAFLIVVFVLVPWANAQTTEFVYQGQLQNSGSSATGNYDFEFLLYDAVSGGAQQGPTLTRSGVAVTSGIFSVSLDFGDQFPGANRFLEIRTRVAGGGAFTTLSPRQPINSVPYAVRSLSAATADSATSAANFTGPLAGDVTGPQSATVIAANAVTNPKIANNAVTAGKIAMGEVVKSINTLKDDVTLAAGTNITITPAGNTLTIASTGDGGGNAILNQTTLQGNANFNIDGGGTANIFNASTQYNLAGSRILSNPGLNNLFAGASAGQSNTTGNDNSFFGSRAGESNTTGFTNSFFGGNAGYSNTTGNFNSFFGQSAGSVNTTGSSNSFFGRSAGRSNTTGDRNAFFGAEAGSANTTGSDNSFVGVAAGLVNTTGRDNSFFGTEAGSANTTGSDNSFVGTFAGASNTTASNNSFFGRSAGQDNTTGNHNSFFGSSSGQKTTTGPNNTFVGSFAGLSNTTGGTNSFFGRNSGRSNTVGSNNSFVGWESGFANTTGNNNAFFGINAGRSNTDGSNNSFFGADAGFANTTGVTNSFFGRSTGIQNTTGSDNSFFGRDAGNQTTAGSGNTFFGVLAGRVNTTGSNNTAIGQNANVSVGNLSFATAIGAGALVSSSNTMVLGRAADTVIVRGSLNVVLLGSGGMTSLCQNMEGLISDCSSSLRYKSNIGSFGTGLSLIRQLRPITFDWKNSGMHDLGLGAEDVAAIEPLLVTYNKSGEVEGVKYDRIGVALINAVKEQQAQIEAQQRQIEAQQAQSQKQQERIERQQKQIDALKQLICQSNPRAEVCREMA